MTLPIKNLSVWLAKAAFVPLLVAALPAHANPNASVRISTCDSTNAKANVNARCSGSLGNAGAGGQLMYYASARSGSSSTDKSGQYGSAGANVAVTNSVGWVLLNKSFTGSTTGSYSRALQNDGRFRITVNITDRKGRTYSFVEGDLYYQASRGR